MDEKEKVPSNPYKGYYDTQRDNINNAYNSSVEQANKDKEQDYKDIAYEKRESEIKAENAYTIASANFGKNAEVLASQGLRNSGYGDYVQAQAYKAYRQEQTDINKAAMKANSEASNTYAKLIAEYDQNRQAALGEIDSKEKLYNVEQKEKFKQDVIDGVYDTEGTSWGSIDSFYATLGAYGNNITGEERAELVESNAQAFESKVLKSINDAYAISDDTIRKDTLKKVNEYLDLEAKNLEKMKDKIGDKEYNRLIKAINDSRAKLDGYFKEKSEDEATGEKEAKKYKESTDSNRIIADKDVKTGTPVIQVPSHWKNSLGFTMHGTHSVVLDTPLTWENSKGAKETNKIHNKVSKYQFDAMDRGQLFIANGRMYIKKDSSNYALVGTGTASYEKMKGYLEDSMYNFDK